MCPAMATFVINGQLLVNYILGNTSIALHVGNIANLGYVFPNLDV